MKITNIRTKRAEGEISILADCKIRPVGWDTVYFTFDKKYAGWLREDASPFAAALLIPSMYRGENLVIEGTVSEKLYQGMHRTMETMVKWNIGMKQIKISATGTTKDDGDPKNVGTFFSGGVDSFYTYLKHKSDKKDKITHFILVHGNDIGLRNKDLWEDTLKSVEQIAKADGIEMVVVKTNVQALIEPMITQDYTHGGCLGGIGLCLRGGFRKIYIPSTFSLDQQVPYGSHPDLDKNWSSEKLSFEHDGTEARRLDKIEWQIAKSPLALEYLRVCYMNIKGNYNCGKCEKCTRTMIALYIAGKLDEVKTFPHMIDKDRVTHLVAHAGYASIIHRENLKAMKERNIDPELQAAIEKGLANTVGISHNYGPIKQSMEYMVLMDHLYLRGKLFATWKTIRNR